MATGDSFDGDSRNGPAPELPTSVRVSLPAPPSSRGPAPTYSRAQVAAAAIAIADEHGIEAVSMRRVAAALGTGPMSLYRYVDNKEALCELMLDHMFGEAELPEPTGDWRADLAEVARSLRRAQLSHPWLARIAAGRPAMGPNMLDIFEYGMSILDRLGLDTADMLEIFALVSSWVGGFVQEEVAEQAARRDRGMDEREWQRSMSRYLETLTGGGNYPYFTRVVRAGADRDFDTRFERGLDRILTGIEATLPR
ncbi:TetR/AcrR family transcriptional regulator [Micromonospora sp. NPDC049523]|uniref:TetR/AcrR family transcriptional regulator n=1 Tax=Micromonospora sp. NPDC049523 TaxID=3155921 RepID=UPI0034341C1B